MFNKVTKIEDTLATQNLILISVISVFGLKIKSRSKVTGAVVNITLLLCNKTGIVPYPL